ncbi:substrate-binding domain-containing protein [Halanaerobium sp. Z-7514]|uniref:Substrate-binding domain-containing protein n=1 Tax=Halanaerobium polyolivorans TaxID=2886943 RepID=A0AAW4X1Q6_9FIRM|nr:substrate-binding domain-containing protein [Halanaerobium polyolivorans]MCC3145700.1 substrate-binding domain-containing protein [Halanaerobium polyolivorans]RQD74342.1 MAG: sugar ABC transporter substrate-binding protein [Halanaerobium sp. MSAO_Bac5]
MKKTLILILVLALVFTFSSSLLAESKEIAVLTPYLESVTTNTMIRAFEEKAEAEGWNVRVIDTKGDFNELANRYEDVIAQGVDAIVMGMGDPNQLRQQINKAVEEGIPVFGGDAGFIEGMKVNVTSNNYVLGAQNTSYLLNRIGSGKIVKLYHSAHPGVYQREVVFDAIVDSRDDIEVVAEHYVQVPGPIENAQQAMQSILLSNPDIDGVWAAWDEPAIGAELAIRQAGRDDIVVVGIDGNSQAIEMIAQGSSIKATVKQDFAAMGDILVEQIKSVFAGEELVDNILYAPADLITEDNAADFMD